MYAIAGTSKQALWSHERRQSHKASIAEEVVRIMEQIRKHHKRMSARKAYQTVKHILPIGRDAFEQIAHANGFKVKLKRNPVKTTWGQRIEVYPNLIEGRTVTGLNQVWQSDIFYLTIESTTYYGVTILDVYSRKLLALCFSRSLRAKETLRAYRKAIAVRQGADLTGCIIHSDRGSQYISTTFKVERTKAGMRPSMCKLPQENAYVERVQGTLKYEYLFEFELTKSNIRNMAWRIMRYYNDERPHCELSMMTPTTYETYVGNLPENKTPEMTIFQGFTEKSTNPPVANKEKSSKKEKYDDGNDSGLKLT